MYCTNVFNVVPVLMTSHKICCSAHYINIFTKVRPSVFGRDFKRNSSFSWKVGLPLAYLYTSPHLGCHCCIIMLGYLLTVHLISNQYISAERHFSDKYMYM